MDLRTKKTQRAIREAFLQLRAKKPLERITVKELAELAEISKATFYLHYQDIYDLSDQLQQEIIEATLAKIATPEELLTDPIHFTQNLVECFATQQSAAQILFSGSQSAVIPARVEEAYKVYSNQHFPHLRDNCQFQTLLTYQVYGAYYAFTRNVKTFGQQLTMDTLHELSKALIGSQNHLDPTASVPLSASESAARSAPVPGE